AEGGTPAFWQLPSSKKSSPGGQGKSGGRPAGWQDPSSRVSSPGPQAGAPASGEPASGGGLVEGLPQLARRKVRRKSQHLTRAEPAQTMRAPRGFMRTTSVAWVMPIALRLTQVRAAEKHG